MKHPQLLTKAKFVEHINLLLFTLILLANKHTF